MYKVDWFIWQDLLTMYKVDWCIRQDLLTMYKQAEFI